MTAEKSSGSRLDRRFLQSSTPTDWHRNGALLNECSLSQPDCSLKVQHCAVYTLQVTYGTSDCSVLVCRFSLRTHQNLCLTWPPERIHQNLCLTWLWSGSTRTCASHGPRSGSTRTCASHGSGADPPEPVPHMALERILDLAQLCTADGCNVQYLYM